jgi:hypothetical protein
VPALKKWIQQNDTATQAKAARTLIQAATMPAD